MHLTIGVTGHRDLVAAEIPALKDRVRDFFRQLQGDYPDLDLQLISPLAEGSDQLVAGIALELGIELIAPLPMSQAEYEQDFSSPKAVGLFRRQLAKAKVIHLTDNSVSAGDPLSESERKRLYARLGVFISNHSQILLALWDGKRQGKIGGASGVVNYHLTAVMPGLSVSEESANLLADNENDLAYHIVCSRDRQGGRPANDSEPLQSAWITAHFGCEAGDNMPAEYKIMLHRLQDFSRDQARYETSIDQQGSDFLNDTNQFEIPCGIGDISKLYKAADWLAIHFQKRVSNGLIATHSLAVLMGLAFIVYSEFDGLEILVLVFLLAFLAGFIIFKIGEKRQWHRKYLDYRALAEGLRVQLYWSLAGVIDVRSTEFAYDNFLQKQDVDLGWIRHVMRNASLLRSGSQQPPAEWVEWVIERWVGNETGDGGQLSYYRRRKVEKSNRFKRTTRLATLSLWTGILIAVVLLILGASLSDFPRHVLLVLMGILPLMAGIRDAYSHKKAEKELIKQYRFMQGVFANARRLLDGSDDVAFQRRILKALGNAALEEDAEWILMHRERPMEHSGI